MTNIEQTLESIDKKLDSGSRFDPRNWWHVVQVAVGTNLVILWLISTLKSGDSAKLQHGVEILLKTQVIDLSTADEPPAPRLANQPRPAGVPDQ